MALAEWLSRKMELQNIRSAGRAAREAGIEPDRFADWVLGRGTAPNESECAALAKYFNVEVKEIHDAMLGRT